MHRLPDIEAEDLDTQICLILDRLFPCIKFLSLVYILAAAVASHGKRCHETHLVLQIFRSLPVGD